MFRFHWNHHQAVLQKYIDPLHGIAKMRYGIAIRPFYKSNESVWDPITHFSSSM